MLNDATSTKVLCTCPYIKLSHLFIDIQMFNAKYLAIHTVQMHTGAISKLLYGFGSSRVTNVIHKLSTQTHKPYKTLTHSCMHRSIYNEAELSAGLLLTTHRKHAQYVTM